MRKYLFGDYKRHPKSLESQQKRHLSQHVFESDCDVHIWLTFTANPNDLLFFCFPVLHINSTMPDYQLLISL